MFDNPVVITVLALIAAAVVAAVVYYVLRFMRGSIKLSLPRASFGAGAPISGSLELHTKKAIQGNQLFVRLIGIRETRTYEDDKQRTETHEIYRDEVVVEGARSYPAGHKETYTFEIKTPNMQSPEFMNSAVGQALRTAFQMLNNRSTRIKWKLEARLDAKGVDLATSKRVSINTGTLS